MIYSLNVNAPQFERTQTLTDLPAGTTVGQALQQLGVPTNNHTIRLNGQQADTGTVVTDGDTISVTPTNLKGA